MASCSSLWRPSLSYLKKAVKAASPLLLSCIVRKTFGARSGAKGLFAISSHWVISRLSSLMLNPTARSISAAASTNSLLLANIAGRPIIRISVSTGTPSAAASASSACACAGS